MEVLNLNIAVLIGTSKPSDLDILVDRLLSDLNILSIKHSFRLLTIRKGFISQPAQDQLLLRAWRNEDFILYVGSPPGAYQNNFTEEIRLKIWNEAPRLATLLFESQKSSIERFKCFFNGHALVYQIPYSITAYEDSILSKLPVLMSAVREAKLLSLSWDSHFVPARCGFLHKSEVALINVAQRPRSSPYPMISVINAVKCVLQETSPLGTEIKSFKDCFGFVLAEDVLAPEPYPPFDASIKDGYALRALDPVFYGDGPYILRVIGNVPTGNAPDCIVSNGTCLRISTGGAVPESANAVVQVEDTRIHSSLEGDEISIEILKKPKFGQDIRSIGIDIPKGAVVIPARKKVTPAEIGILALLGISSAFVYKKPWIAVMSTGDEIVEPENLLLPGCIRDSNKSTLCQMLLENRIPFIDVGIAKDEADAIKSHLMLALNSADIVITTGGVSMGEKDMLKQVLERDFNAIVHFGRVHMKPGKPTTFSTTELNGEKKIVFSLPGNPVSACVCFYLFVIPCIRKMMGCEVPEYEQIKVKLEKDQKLDERPEFVRVSLSCGADGVLVSQVTGVQRSSRLLSMQNADALLVLPPKTEELPLLKAGTLVDAIVIKPI